MGSLSGETEDWIIVDPKDITSDVDLLGDSGSTNHSSGIAVWTLWMLGSVIGITVPLYRRIISTEEATEKTADTTLKAVEKIAEVTEKIASEIAAELPDCGKLKQKALQMEEICGMIDEDAKVAEAFIHKVDHIKEEVHAIAEPIIEKAEVVKEIRVQESRLNPGPAVGQLKTATYHPTLHKNAPLY